MISHRDIPNRVRQLFVCTSLLFLGVFFAGSVGEAAEPVVTIVTDHADAVYAVDEPVLFTIQVNQDDKPLAGTVNWTLSKDGGTLLQSGRAELIAGEATVTGSLGEPGFIHLTASYVYAGKTYSKMVGVGIDPTAIKPSMPVPDDFDAFWDGKKAELAAVPPVANVKPVSSGDARMAAYEVEVAALGAPVTGYLVKPIDAEAGTLPIIITLQGAGVANSSLVGARGWAQEDMIAFSLNAHGLPLGQPSDFYSSKYPNGELGDYRIRGRESREEFYFLGMFLRIVRAIDYLTTLPEWDGKTVILYGTSQGGAQAYAGAGLDERVTFFVAGVTSMADMTGFAANRGVGGHSKALTTGVPLNRLQDVITTMRYFDAMNFATRVKADGFFTVGFVDTNCLPTTVYAAYNNVPTNKAIYNDLPTGHANSTEAVRLMKTAVREHVAKMKQQP
ncbi:MAG: acetylxylan esterase [Limnochordia bacterium]